LATHHQTFQRHPFTQSLAELLERQVLLSATVEEMPLVMELLMVLVVSLKKSLKSPYIQGKGGWLNYSGRGGGLSLLAMEDA